MKHMTLLLLAGSLLFLSTSCGSARWVRTPVLESARATVHLEHQRTRSGITPQGYDHPWTVPLGDMEKLLRELTYEERDALIISKETNPVFQAGEIAALAPVLTDALAKATPDQRVGFVSFNKGGGLIFKNTRRTEGILFVSPKGRCNLAFGLINHEETPYDGDDWLQNRTETDPLRIHYADTVLNPQTPYTRPAVLKTGKPAPMWVVVDLALLHEAALATPTPPPAPPAAQAPSPPQPGAEPAVKPVPAPVSATPPPATLPAPPAGATPPQPAPSDIHTAVKAKLKYLKELYDDGLITESEYQAEKKKLLEKID